MTLKSDDPLPLRIVPTPMLRIRLEPPPLDDRQHIVISPGGDPATGYAPGMSRPWFPLEPGPDDIRTGER